MVDLLEARRRILLNTPHLESISGATASFSTDMVARLKECKIHFTPIQEGTGDPSPDNVRPISGWDGVTIEQRGKNLFDTTGESEGRFINSSGTSIANSDWNHSDYIKVKPATTYTFNPNTTAGSTAKHWFYNAQKTKISYIASGGGTFTTPEDAEYMRFSYRKTSASIQLEIGSTATAYEPYTATTLTIPFPQTIYGGYVDLVNGEVVEEWRSSTIDGNERISNSSNRFYVQNAFPENAANVTGNISDKYKYSDTIYSSSPYGRFTVRNKTIYMTPPDGTDIARNDVDTFKAWLVDNHVSFCYKLATPITYPLDPVTIRTLKGLNNIWSNANGNIEVKFWTH